MRMYDTGQYLCSTSGSCSTRPLSYLDRGALFLRRRTLHHPHMLPRRLTHLRPTTISIQQRWRWSLLTQVEDDHLHLIFRKQRSSFPYNPHSLFKLTFSYSWISFCLLHSSLWSILKRAFQNMESNLTSIIQCCTVFIFYLYNASRIYVSLISHWMTCMLFNNHSSSYGLKKEI